MHYDDQTKQRSQDFRKGYRESTPSWYRGEMHLAFTLLFSVAPWSIAWPSWIARTGKCGCW
jgi:hypothetical protein